MRGLDDWLLRDSEHEHQPDDDECECEPKNPCVLHEPDYEAIAHDREEARWS